MNHKIQLTLSMCLHYAGDVNGKQQDKIQKFLDDKNIKSDVLDK